MPPGGDEAASALVSHHHRAAVEAYAAASRVAPNCVMTAVFHAEALANDHRFADAMLELDRVLTMTTNHDDPGVHHVVYDLIGGTPKGRKSDAVNKAGTLMEKLAARINNEIVPRQAAKLLRGDATVGQVQERAKLLSEEYPYSPRAQLLRVYIELEQARAVDEPLRRKGLLRGVLDLVSDAADSFDSSLLIALFHAKVLFVLDMFDESEGECRRALRIEEPTDPSFDDIPPDVSVPGADCDARVSSLKKQLRVLLKQIIVVAGLCWSSIQTTQHGERVISVRVDTLQEHYDGIDQSAAKTISGAVRFLKNQSSWSFFICPISSCDGKKFVDTGTLWIHMRSKHRDELWNKLQSVLGPDLNEIASKDDHSLDGITLSQDSKQRDIFNLPRVQDMFESLLLSPSIGIQQAEPLVEMRRRKCREGAEILEDIKKKLRMLPKNKLSTQYEEFCFPIQNLWLKFLETSALDHREVILPLARSFQWIEMKRLIALSAKDLGKIIGGLNIDAVFGKASAAPDHQSRDNLQSENIKPSGADGTLKADEKCEESEVRVPNSNSGTMVGQSSSDPPTDVHGNVMNIPARNAEVELDKKGTFGPSVKEMASTSSSQQSLNVFNKNNADKDLSILSLIIRSLCNLRHFRDKLLTDPLVWIPSVDNPCIAQKFYEIFYSWEKNDHHLTDAVLTYMKTLLCRILDCTTFSEKVETNFASDIVVTILIELHMSETCSRFSLNKETEKHVVNPITCGDCICPTHNIFGVKFNAQMSCKCGKSSDEYLYSALFHKLDAGSPQTTKVKSFVELPFLLDEQLCKDNICEECGSPQNIDRLLSNTPHFLTIVLSWLGSSESQDTLSEVLGGIASPVDTGFFCKSADSSTMYTVTSMICYADESYVCFARDDEDKWLIYGFETVETQDTWEHLLARFKDCKLQPEVLFFEAIEDSTLYAKRITSLAHNSGIISEQDSEKDGDIVLHSFSSSLSTGPSRRRSFKRLCREGVNIAKLFAYQAGVSASALGDNLQYLNDEFTDAQQFFKHMGTYKATGHGYAARAAGEAEKVSKVFGKVLGAGGLTLGCGGAALSSVGFSLQKLHPEAQSGGSASHDVVEIVTMKSMEEAETILNEWKISQDIVVAEVPPEMDTELAKKMMKLFIDAGALDLVKNSPILRKKAERVLDDSCDWHLV